MKRLIITIFTLALLFSLEGCFLFPDSSSKETLPPATQTGANTMGFLLNGQVWLPIGNGAYPNLIPVYDPNFNGKPIFNMANYRYVSNDDQFFGFGITGIKGEGIYRVSIDSMTSATFGSNKCNYYYHDTTVYQKGAITITKFALPIISGTFDFTFFKPNCDTIKITQGRFDIKL